MSIFAEGAEAIRRARVLLIWAIIAAAYVVLKYNWHADWIGPQLQKPLTFITNAFADHNDPAFMPDGRTLLTGGAARMVRQWDVETGAPLGGRPADVPDALAAFAGDPGAEAFRACIACHTLDPAEGERAGPTLQGIFGRRIASVPGYRYSEALSGMDIVWTPETVSRLFEVGPATFTPGTTMPEQVIGDEARAALIRFLEKATQPPH